MKKTCFILLILTLFLSVAPMMSSGAEAEPEQLQIEPYSDGNMSGWQNWRGDGDESGHTNLVILVKSRNNYVGTLYDWKITFNSGSTSRTVTLKNTSFYDQFKDSVLYRFKPCDASPENRFIPMKNVNYTVSVELYHKGVLIMESNKASGFIMKDNPIYPKRPVMPGGNGLVDIDFFGDKPGDSWENKTYSGFEHDRTHLVLTMFNKNNYAGKMYDWRLTFKDQGTGEEKTSLLKCTSHYDLSNQGVMIYRFQPCHATGENRFVPKPGTKYSLKAEVLYEDKVILHSNFKSGFDLPSNFHIIAPDYNFSYKLKDGVLTITERGKVEAKNVADYPWYKDRDSIEKVVIGEGVTSLGREAFFNYPNLKEVTVGKRCKALGTYAFAECPQLKVLHLESKIESLGNGVALRSLQLSTVVSKLQTKEDFMALDHQRGGTYYTLNFGIGMEEDGNKIPFSFEKVSFEKEWIPEPEPPVKPSEKPVEKPTPSVPSETAGPSENENEKNVAVPLLIGSAILLGGVAIVAVILQKKKKK